MGRFADLIGAAFFLGTAIWAAWRGIANAPMPEPWVVWFAFGLSCLGASADLLGRDVRK